ncbi:hypothetical protein KUTeg_011791 [Tegillarca granosa]|uniref:Glycosyltransferase family 92 protein n=1 Tax=Tegillarca granosa TaxID=220873 RepID=A0ABQ9F151_TEGGR|nr:hypothetical protein KUTeg_011791 [Tegillarca granosa]
MKGCPKMRFTNRRMRFRSLPIRYLIPIMLIFYTIIMVLIQLGIPDKRLFLEKFDGIFPNDLELIKGYTLNSESYVSVKTEYFQLQKGPNYFPVHKEYSKQVNGIYATNVNKNGETFIKVGNVSVFSVYFDNRPSIIPNMRIIALKQFLSEENLVCHFENKGRWIAITAESYEMCENHGRFYGGWIYSCKIPINFLQKSSKISTLYLSSTFLLNIREKFNITAKTMIYKSDKLWIQRHTQIKQQIKIQHKGNFGMCLPPLFGDISLSLLIQFIELSKILGATHFTFYKHNISETVEKILSYYQNLGEVEVVNWKLPPEVSEREIWYHGQILAIQDCLYRNMARFEYLIFVDIDEFIIPKNEMTWIEMLNFNTNNNNKLELIAGYSFKSAFFDPKQIPDMSQQLTFLQLLQRNVIYSTLRTKLIVRPQMVFEMGIHHASKLLNMNFTVLEIKPEIAIIHHYRPCVINYEPTMKCYKSVRDDTILKYEEVLVEQYKAIVRNTVKLFVPKNDFNSN